MNLIQIIKQAAMEAVEHAKPSGIVFGTVNSINPLSVQLDQKITLSDDFLVSRSQLPTFTIGDQLILIQMQGGQQFVILDKVVNV
jgi:hypothetical protein